MPKSLINLSRLLFALWAAAAMFWRFARRADFLALLRSERTTHASALKVAFAADERFALLRALGLAGASAVPALSPRLAAVHPRALHPGSRRERGSARRAPAAPRPSGCLTPRAGVGWVIQPARRCP